MRLAESVLRKQENEEQLAQIRQDVEAKAATQLTDADDESECEPDTESEVPIDSDGDVAMDYYHNVIPDTFVNPVKGTVVDFGAIVWMPSFCPDAHLFRAQIDHNGMTWDVEWDCVPGKRIVPNWARPDRIVLPECPVDEDGYMTWEYMESLDKGVQFFLTELPRFCPVESLFRTTGKTSDGQPVVVEWACIPGKRRLVATKTDDIGTIDDWASPSRIIHLDEFTDERIKRGGLLAGSETEDEVCQWYDEFLCACDYDDEPDDESEYTTSSESKYDTPDEHYDERRINLVSDIHIHQRRIQDALKWIPHYQEQILSYEESIADVDETIAKLEIRLAEIDQSDGNRHHDVRAEISGQHSQAILYQTWMRDSQERLDVLQKCCRDSESAIERLTVALAELETTESETIQRAIPIGQLPELTTASTVLCDGSDKGTITSMNEAKPHWNTIRDLVKRAIDNGHSVIEVREALVNGGMTFDEADSFLPDDESDEDESDEDESDEDEAAECPMVQPNPGTGNTPSPYWTKQKQPVRHKLPAITWT